MVSVNCTTNYSRFSRKRIVFIIPQQLAITAQVKLVCTLPLCYTNARTKLLLLSNRKDSHMAQNTPITVARGDGIGPEIMDATLHSIKAPAARIEIEEGEVGETVYLRGINAGIEPCACESLRRTTVCLNAHTTTPQGAGYKSLN